MVIIDRLINMKFEEHCQRSRELFGYPYETVHKFLDTFANTFAFGHRMVLHNTYGIEMVRIHWNSDMAADVAKQHIIDDLGHVPTPEEWLDSDGALSMHKPSKMDNDIAN